MAHDARLPRLLFLLVPLAWIVVCNIAPLVEMLRISLLDAYPPRAGEVAQWSLANYAAFFETASYRVAFRRSLVLAAATTLAALVVCFPLAYHVALKVRPERRAARLMLLVAPFWTSEIIRIFGIGLLLSNRGAINTLLRAAGVIDAPLKLLYGPLSLALGMVSIAFLAMLLPIFAALERLPREWLEAATDLGARPWQRLVTITLPASAGGIAAGCALVFLLSLGAYAVPERLGGPDTTVFADLIGGFFNSAANRWPTGAAFSVTLLVSGGAVSAALLALARPRPGSA
jgi:spermidine/putrescine transport system permease protein